MCIILVMKYYPYEEFKTDTLKLAGQLQSFKPEAIVAIARGGMSLAHALAQKLNIRNVQSLRCELYDDTTKRELLRIKGGCEFDEQKKVLVVDDISDSGQTLKGVMEYFKTSYPQIEFYAATLFYKKTSVYEPDVWIREADEWIEFFWEEDFKAD